MGWFEHEHYWVRKPDTNCTIGNKEGGTVGMLIIEDCRCGAVRQIEFKPGEQPIVRMAKVEKA